ncbi:MAG: penicillin-binding transpeptidase domain-containing protein [Candidatus Competibacteraceae bacterium]
MRRPRREESAWWHRLWASARTITRIGLVLGLMGTAATGMVARAAYLQLINKDFLQEQGDGRFLRKVEVPAHRGMIVDRNGEPLAVSSPVDSIWAEPKDLLEQRARWPQLAAALGMTIADLESKLAPDVERRQTEKKLRGFVYLRRRLPPDTAGQVLQLGIPGVHSQREYRRYYPDAEVTSHLLGFTDIKDEGQEGLEKVFDSPLRGVPGQKRVIQDRLGRIVQDVESLQPPQPGQKLTLSIDRRLQYHTYRALKAAFIQHKASGGAAVIVDVKTGEILALVSQPAGNPNNRNELESDLFRNRAVADAYEPGSTMKPFSVAMALESGKWTPTTPVDTRGPFRVGRNLVRDVHNYGLIDVTHVIIKSSNIGTSKMALSLPAEQLWKFYKDLGFGALTGLGLVGEQPGVLRHFKKWGGGIGHANHSFGYGLSVNMLQLAQAYTALAADGVRRPLTLLKRDEPLKPNQEPRVMSKKTAAQMRAMLEQATTQQGTGAKATVPGYRVAGKTGTSHKSIGGRYARSRYLSLFAGMVPASDPRLVMVIIIDEPKGGVYYGGAVAAPVFGATMGEVLRILNITPDDMPSMKIAGVDSPVGATKP